MQYLVFDTGFYMEVARALGKNMEDVVYYFVDWIEPYPRIEKYAVGDGFPEFIKLVDVGESLMASDVVVFPDVGYGGLADYLRMQNKAVFGASGKGQRLELDREFMHKIATEYGIKRPRTRIAYGVEELKKVVGAGNKYIKISTFRGNMETVRIEKPEEIDVVIDEAKFGPYVNEMEYIVEDAVDGAVEIGCDVLFDGEEFVRPYLFGIEVKGKANYSVWVEKSVLDDELLNKLEPFLREAGYRGTISFEGMLNESGFYLIDVTARYPFPAEGILTKSVDNYAEIVSAIANGEYPEIKPKHRHGAELVLYTGVHDKWFPVTIDDEIKEKINYKNMVLKGDVYWHVPGEIVGSIVEFGENYEELQKMLENDVEHIRSQDLIYSLDAWKEFNVRREQLKDIFGYDILISG